MTKYEEVLDQAHYEDITVYENYIFSDRIKGLYCNGSIALNKDMSEVEKKCVLAEELGHHYTAVGDILDQSLDRNRKQELRGRLVAYNKLIGLRGLVDAYTHHCHTLSEAAEYLEVTQEFLEEAVNCYRNKYGVYTEVDNYVIMFEPNLALLELL